MKNRKLQRIIAFASSAAIILSTNGVQYMAQEIGSAVHAEEVILEEDCSDTDTGSVTDGVEAQEVDVWSSYEEPEITVEGIEVSSSAEAEQATGTSLSVDEASETDEDMLVDVRLTEEAQAKAEDGYAQGEVQWMHVYAADRSSADSGEAAVRIYLTDLSDETPAEEVDVFLFDEWKETLPGTVVLPPVVLEDALNGNEDLRITRVQEYKKDENDEYVKDSEGNRIMTADYLEFTLPAGDYAEFSAAMMYRTDAEEYSYSASAYADVMQVTEDGTERVLYDEYSDKKKDNELTVTWEPQEEETEAVTENGTEETTETVTETVTEAVTEAAAEEVTEAATEVSAEDAAAEAMTEESTETVSEAVDAESTEDTTEAITEAAAEGETELSGEVESETELSSEAESETELSSEAEGETELSSEAESETELSSEAESETELSSEAESETELSSEIESESELSSEVESESETEIESESESGTESAETEAPVSSIRVIMTKELEETETPQADAEAAILSEEGSEAEAQETAAETAEADSESEAAADDTAVSGQTFIVHVQAEDLQPDAQYDSTVSIHLTDLATGLPASDVATAVCQMKEDVLATESAAVNTLYGAVHTPDGTENLVVSRVQETVTAEDGTVTVTDDYLKFDLPAGSSADFYIGFTYATEADAYEKQLMVEVRAVQYIPVQETEAETGAGPEETEISGDTAEQTEGAVQTEAVTEPTLPTTDTNIIDNLSSMAEDEITEELTDAAVTPTADQELLSAASLEENEELSVKTQSADADNSVLAGLGSTDAETEAGADTDGSTVNALTVESTETEGTDTELVEVNVLSSESTLMSMTWAASARSTGLHSNYLYLNPAGMTLEKKDWTSAGTLYLFVESWGGFQSGTKDSYTGYWYWNLSPWGNKNHKFGFAYSDDWPTIESGGYYRTEYSSIELSEAGGKVYVQNGTASTKINGRNVYAIKEFTSYAGQNIYFFDYTESVNGVSAIFSTDGNFGKSECKNVSAEETGVYSFMIPDDYDGSEYKYIKFVDSEGKQLGNIYNIYGESVSGDGVESITYGSSSNTFFYGATKLSDSTLRHAWGALPTGTSSLAGKRLYFDKLFFPAADGGKLQIGENTPIELKADSSDERTLSYTFVSEDTATQQTILTYIDKDNNKYHFLWSDLTSNEVELNDEVAYVTSTYAKGYTIYFDATLSKLSYKGSVTTNATIPAYENDDTSKPYEIYYHAWNTTDDVADGTMELLSAYSRGANKWEDVYVADLTKQYKNILFYSSSKQNSYPGETSPSRTGTLTIPWTTVSDPCFYADSSDAAIYTTAAREGYWDEVYQIRDAEDGKGKDVVPIATSTTFTRAEDVKYVNSTLYDYYSDYELNGNQRTEYSSDAKVASFRVWYPFRQFDQALSSYYESRGASYPLYTGHFQPSTFENDTLRYFDTISNVLNLYGDDNCNAFVSSNNSLQDANGTPASIASGGKGNYDKAAQGLVSSSLSNGNLMIQTSGGTVASPYFNSSFLQGSNSKNAVIGDVYEDVSFPFTKKWYGSDGKPTEEGADDAVEYWWYDSNEKGMLLTQADDTGELYLDNTKDKIENLDSGGTAQGTYGFFPFNATPTGAAQRNYGYGIKLEFEFKLTEDGKVTCNDGETKQDIQFNFSGDDDVWVFIDGKLALDIGGAHGKVSGKLDFADKTWTVSGVKESAATSGATSGTFTMQGSNTDTHTLTMFYMERGMWESNMLITFNFPEENVLEVEKQVDTTDVNPLFSDLFNNVSLFTFNIKNLATHYGSKASSTESISPVNFNVSDWSSVSNNTCEHVTYEGKSATHWYANLTDTTSAYRHKRYGTMMTNEQIDISQMSYLEFKYYYPYTDTPSLSYMYLQLVDTDGKVKGNMSQEEVASTDTLSGKIYGTVTMGNYKWVTVRIDLSKLKEETGFNNNVQSIKFGYNYDRVFYLADWIFYPLAEVSKPTGFVTQQYEISDYGSATSGKLEIPVGAQYSSSNGKHYVIGKDGTFVLENGESIVFEDQFRRGSYIYLTEENAGGLFDTSWTMYANGNPVTSMATGTTVTNGMVYSLNLVPGKSVDDGRTEKVLPGKDADGQKQENEYKGTKPSDPTFVFRSYANPDSGSIATRLKVVFYNKVNTGSLKIKKSKAYDNDDLGDTEYRFRITYTNVGGLALESKPIVDDSIRLKAGEEITITGIPLGTYIKVEEIPAEDGSSLDSVTAEPSNATLVDPETKTMQGIVTTEETSITAEFKNTKKPLIDVSVEKFWKDSAGNDLTDNLPESIKVQLQRRKEGSSDPYKVIPENSEYNAVKLEQRYGGWCYKFTGLEQYEDYTADTRVKWDYRVVELDSNGNAIEDGKFNDQYRVTYGCTPELNSDNQPTGNFNCTITNTLTNTNLNVIKKDSADETIVLPGVTFKLVKLDSNGAETSTVQTVETNTNGIAQFTNLENGTYRLTETETIDGYILNNAAAEIVIARGQPTECTIDKKEYTITDNTIKYIVTNVPLTNIRITKVAAGENQTKLGGVEFKLEKLNTDGMVDSTFEAITGTTSSAEETKGIVEFNSLETGTYQLTETKAASGYSLLKSPIQIVINRTQNNTKCTVDDGTVKVENNTISITIQNQPKFAIPATGSWSNYIIIFSGMMIAGAALIMYLLQKRRKEGRAS